jgi:hypothetical protein
VHARKVVRGVKIEERTSGPSGHENQASQEIKNIGEYTEPRRLRFRDLGGRVTFVTAFGKQSAVLLSSKF